jgi:heat shock protein HslJ
MNFRMKYLVLAPAFLFAIATGAHRHSLRIIAETVYSQALPDSVTIEGKWQLMPVLSSDTATGKIPWINFDIKSGRFAGNTGCNAMNGTFIIKQDALSFGENLISTRMDCTGYNEKPFIDNLLKTNRYEIKDGVLQLMYNTTILSKWVSHIDSTATKQI